MNSKIVLSARKLKHGNVCKGILKMLFQKYKIELTTLYKLATILFDHAFVNYKYYLRHLVIGHKQNFSEQIDFKKVLRPI